MRNKGAILVLAISLALVCIYQLSFTWKAATIHNDAKEYAQGDPIKEDYYLDSLASVDVFNIGIKKYTYREVQEREINFGLDLKGGMNVILEVSVVDVIRSLSNNSTDTTFTKALTLAKQMQKHASENYITLFGKAFEQIDPNARLSAIFNTVELRDKIDYNTSNADVLKVIRNEAQGAIDNAFNIIRTRIDQFGVTQPNVQKLESGDRILVDLPGVKNKDRVRKLLQGTANLEFWETYENSELINGIYAANDIIKDYLKTEHELARDTLKTETPEVTSKVEEKKEAKGSDKELSLLQQIASDTTTNNSLTQNATDDPYPLFRIFRPMVNQETGEPYGGSVIGHAHYKDTTKINFYLKLAAGRNVFPRDVRFYWSALPIRDTESKKSSDTYSLYAIKVTSRNGQAPLDGDAIVAASQEFDQTRGSANVTMSMNGEGSKVWARLTKENLGKVICIVMDGRVYSGATVRTEITGGNSEISGDFTVNEAQDLANLLKSGKLPAPAHIIQETVVGPSLGEKAVRDGFSSFVIAFLVVLVYMVFYYSRKAGFVADIALVANMFFIAGVLASLGAALTLPGIAGIVLTLGMSVDANVLIYERTREEIAAGKGVRMALSDGYKNAYSAIIDGNVTTLITGIILYIFGTGPIKGFATTLVIGILTSLFSAIFITRLIFEWYLNRNKDITFSTKITEKAFKNVNFNFVGRRKPFYIISSIIILVGVISLFTRGLDAGVDFTGGRNFIILLDQPVKTTDVAKSLEVEFGNAPTVIAYGADDQVRITTRYKIDEDGTEIDDEIQQKIYTGLTSYLSKDKNYETFMNENWQGNQKVGPSIADDIKRQAVLAIALALVFMFLYIVLRFRNWQYGLGAIVALMHDALFVLGVYSLFYGYLPFSLEIDQSFIAAILTVVGYSVNDTVIIFDRIREYVGLYPKRDRLDIMNQALNSTLSRTFSTSFSTIIVLLAIFIFGGEVIRGFVFALLLGIGVGTYSSLFIATPIVYDTIRRAEASKLFKRNK